MNRIEIILQSFTQPCEVQKSLFPNFSNVADELAKNGKLFRRD